MPALSVVIPTYGRQASLRRVLDLLEHQTAGTDTFEVIVVADARERRPDDVKVAVGARPYRVRQMSGYAPGASPARNAGWHAAQAPIVLFIGDDILPAASLVERHLISHRRHPHEGVGVLGRVTWARELRVTPFMRWLEHGYQFDYPSIRKRQARWWHFYTANVSLKRTMLERAGGFDESFPFLYEDIDLGKRLERLGFSLLYEPQARGEHLHPATIDDWKRRMIVVAHAEHRFVRKHPDARAHFLERFRSAMAAPPPRGRGARLAGLVPRRTPLLGKRVWASADATYARALAPSFLAAWDEAEDEAERHGTRSR